MRNIAILALASMFVLGATDALAGTAGTDNVIADDFSQYCMPYGNKNNVSYCLNDERNYNYSCIFAGVSLTEQQRQQIWDLVKKQRLHEKPVADIRAERRKMYSLLDSTNFDEAAVRSQLEKIAKENVDLSVEIARIRNQIYQLLTTEQKVQLQRRYEVRVNREMN
ncbi:Periplasmic protein [Xenorhabdus bovienii str. Jollieti]|uniref:Periplasmic protein n=1 Tax=Xenorhabdus bovienii (strain SS-2004) TaxID=406818 RepID=D3V6Y4_XENBS|nr:Spy/CpxP family protein refolding chaperone [Xenorhabdus bovienii]CBJ83413.1 Periplasmic protein [Xenorhabdus bovienii SS-2004]CDH29323.1 Periplasmic protein [Xenorhabdus bovienii str. Jollieti]